MNTPGPDTIAGEFYQIFKKEKLTNLHAEKTTYPTYLWRSQLKLNRASLVAEMLKNLPVMQETQV